MPSANLLLGMVHMDQDVLFQDWLEWQMAFSEWQSCCNNTEFISHYSLKLNGIGIHYALKILYANISNKNF